MHRTRGRASRVTTYLHIYSYAFRNRASSTSKTRSCYAIVELRPGSIPTYEALQALWNARGSLPRHARAQHELQLKDSQSSGFIRALQCRFFDDVLEVL